MLLAIDIGNSHTVIGIFDGSRLVTHWRINTNKDMTADETASILTSLCHLKSVSIRKLEAAIIASVVPPLDSVYVDFLQYHLNITPIVVNSKIKTGITITTDYPLEVGADRIVNAEAAYEKYPQPLIIVDFGTAITFDCVSGKGEYLGGAIAPGISISLEALTSRTAKLPKIDVSTAPTASIGTNTVDAIKSGILFGFGGLVEGILARIKKEFKGPPPITIATGGMARLISPYAPSINKIEPMLTLEGLQLLYEKNP